jgi:hypothetical protein
MHNWYVFFLNVLHLNVSVTLDHHQGAYVTEYNNLTVCAIVQDTVMYKYVFRSKPSCSTLTFGLKNPKKSCYDV